MPVVSGREMAKFLEEHGYNLDRRTKDGSCLYICVTKGPMFRSKIGVPMVEDLEKRAILRMLRDAGISREDFIKYFRK